MPAVVTTFVRGLQQPENVFRKWQGAYTVAAAWLGLFLAAITPPHGTGMTVCWIKQGTGIDCLGCGLTRSMSCGLRGMFAQSLSYHPFGLFILALFLFTAIVSLIPAARQRVAVVMAAWPIFFNALYLTFVVAFVGFGSVRALVEIIEHALAY
jgi:hypothetical protein